MYDNISQYIQIIFSSKTFGKWFTTKHIIIEGLLCFYLFIYSVEIPTLWLEHGIHVGEKVHSKHVTCYLFTLIYARRCKFNVNAEVDVYTSDLISIWDVLCYYHFPHAIKIL